MVRALIFITGLPGSGKSFAAEVIKRRFHAKTIKSGDVIRDEIRRRGWKYTPENDRRASLWFHQGREHLIAKRMWGKMKNYKGIVVIDGLRTPKHLFVLRKLCKGRVIVLRIDSSFKSRSKRTIKRARFGEKESAALLRSRDKRETESLKGLNQVMKKADYAIDNSGLTKSQMEGRVVAMVRDVLK
jgi:dephospho-CoA kinase